VSSIKKIAIIDDDQVFQMIVKKQLNVNNINCEILPFYNGEEAFQHFKKNIDSPEKLPEYVMLDVNMPIKDGWDFLEDYKTLPDTIREKVKLYLVTSSVMKSDIERAEEEIEIDDYISKPVSSQKLTDLFG